MNPEWLSAHLDGELAAAETAELELALAADPSLAAELAELHRVRDVLRAAAVDVPDDAMARVLAAVASADEEPASPAAPGHVVALRRRRVPSLGAAAAALVIIASVVGGVGGTAFVPAVGDLIARHEAAASGSEAFMADADEMPMDMAATLAPPMPTDYSIQHAFVDGSTVHLLFLSNRGSAVSVFRQDGEPDMDALPDGKMADMNGTTMWSSQRDTAHVAVVDGSGYVWVVVGSDADDTMMDTMTGELPARSPSVGDRLRDVARAAVEPFAVWD